MEALGPFSAQCTKTDTTDGLKLAGGNFESTVELDTILSNLCSPGRPGLGHVAIFPARNGQNWPIACLTADQVLISSQV